MKHLLIIVLFAIVSLSAQATTWTVDSLNDAGYGSLRAAADSCMAGDTIRFSPSLIASGSDTITLTTGQIDFGGKGVVIKGLYNSTDTLCISGNDSSRIFYFGGAGRVVLDSLVLRNGNGVGYPNSGYGGAVLRNQCWDTLFVVNSSISGNTAVRGGGVSSSPSSSTMYNYSPVIVINSTISGNTATFGGGIYSYNCPAYISVSVTNSTISGNTANAGGGIFSSGEYLSISSIRVSNSIISGNTASEGGGIYSYSNNNSSVWVTNSTISANTASYSNGGGIFSDSYGDTSSIIVTNSTISGNTAVGEGGGIYSYGDNSGVDSYSLVSVTNSTISGNSANTGGGLYSGCSQSSYVNIISSTVSGNTAVVDGGGIYSFTNDWYTIGVEVTNSTISANTASVNGAGIYSNHEAIKCTSSIVAENGSNSSGLYGNLLTNIISGGYNIFSDILSGSIASDSSNITIAQLNLQGLAYNGGTTQTMMPGVGSVALDSGNPNDTSDAQNAPIIGIRNIGAAENCFSSPSSISVFNCFSYTVPSGSNTYTQSGIYIDTVSTGCGLYSVLTINLTIGLNPSFTYTDNGNGNYSFTNTTTGNYSNSHWAFGDGVTSDLNSTSHTYTANGTYVVVLAIHDSTVVGDSCISYFTDTISVTGVTNPTQCNAGWTVFADSTTGGVTIVNSSTGTNLTYHWDFGDGDTSNLQFPSHTYASNGPFNLCLTINDGNGCSDSYCDSISANGVLFKNGFDLNVVANYPLGIQNLGKEGEVKIYPNPTSTTLTIETQNFKITKIQIRDNTGKVVKTITSNFDIVNVERLATGVYHLELIGESETVTKKFIKQ